MSFLSRNTKKTNEKTQQKTVGFCSSSPSEGTAQSSSSAVAVSPIPQVLPKTWKVKKATVRSVIKSLSQESAITTQGIFRVNGSKADVESVFAMLVLSDSSLLDHFLAEK